MKKILKQLFCKHKWILIREVNDRGLWQCYCEKCHKMQIKSTGGGILH